MGVTTHQSLNTRAHVMLLMDPKGNTEHHRALFAEQKLEELDIIADLTRCSITLSLVTLGQRASTMSLRNLCTYCTQW